MSDQPRFTPDAMRTMASVVFDDCAMWQEDEQAQCAAMLQQAAADADALQAAIDESEWKPIETAPKDGRWILVYCPHGQYVVSWQDDPIAWWFVSDNKSGPYALRGASPTHWKELSTRP